MNRITLHNVLPEVFAGREPTPSEVWQQEVTFERGKRYLVSAESGTGKSSLCSYIYGYRVDYSGTICFDDKDIRQLTVDEWCAARRERIAYLPQDMRLFPELTAFENVQLKNQLTDHKSHADIEAMFARLGISDKFDSPVAHLSIGQQQRVAIIRALCQPFRFIILDEPVSHLDEENNRIVSRLVEEEAERNDAAIISTSVGNHVKINAQKIFTL